MKKDTILRELGKVVLVDELYKLLKVLEEKAQRLDGLAIDAGDEVTLEYPEESSLRRLNGRKVIVQGIERGNILILDRGMTILVDRSRIKVEPKTMDTLEAPKLDKGATSFDKTKACLELLEHEEDINYFTKEITEKVDHLTRQIASAGDKVILNFPSGTRMSKYDRMVCQVKGNSAGRLIIELDNKEYVIDHSRVLQLLP